MKTINLPKKLFIWSLIISLLSPLPRVNLIANDSHGSTCWHHRFRKGIRDAPCGGCNWTLTGIGRGCNSPGRSGHGGWWECFDIQENDLILSGSEICKTISPPFNYVTETPCVAKINVPEMTLCAAAFIGLATVNTTACIGAAGTIVLTPACLTLLASTATAGMIQCHPCTTHDCVASATGSIDRFVDRQVAEGPVCFKNKDA